MARLLLLDVSPLIALAWPNHPFHAASLRRLSGRTEWATCAVTQLAFIRLSMNPAVVHTAKSAAEVTAMLAAITADSRHTYFENLPGPTSRGFGNSMAGLWGHQQVTDAYLLALAEHHSATLLTFDARMKALAQNPSSVEVLVAL